MQEPSAVATKSVGEKASLGLNYNGVTGYRSDDEISNFRIRPERRNEYEGGTDLSLFNGRMGISTTIYNAISTDIIYDIDVIPSTGADEMTANGASIQNNGLELTFDYRVLDSSTQEIVSTAKRTGAQVRGPIPLPNKIEKYTVLRGLNWEIPFSIGGVNSDADFSLELSSGKDMVKELLPGMPRSYIHGKGVGSGTIEVIGLRKRDKKSSITSAKIVVVDPQYSSPSEDKEIYIGESYVFDSRVKDVDRDRISVKMSGSAVNTKTYNSYEAKLNPKSRGKVEIQSSDINVNPIIKCKFLNTRYHFFKILDDLKVN